MNILKFEHDLIFVDDKKIQNEYPSEWILSFFFLGFVADEESE